MLLQGLSALLLGCSCVGGTTVVVPQLDEKDHAGLDALRDAQPPSARAACATLAGWKHPVPPCEWPGVTCTEPVNGTMRVHVIDLRYCGLTVLPAAALVWDELEVLELRGNLIAELPTTVNQLSNMQRIFLEMNQVRELPNTLCELKKLTNLYIAFNKLTALPSCIGDLGSTLGDIWLRGNNIPTLPESFCELVHLGSAYIMEAGFEELPACFGRVGSALRYTHLELENNKLKELPDSMASMFAEGRMSALNLAGNQMTALPTWVGPLATNITAINIENNNLRHLPTALPPALTVLRLGDNPIVSAGIAGAQRENLIQLLQSLPRLETFTVGMAKGGQQRSWDGFQHDYVVTAMPGLVDNGGSPKCPADSMCPFEIKTDWNSNNYATGGLQLSYCLNITDTDGSCGCDMIPPDPSSCIALVDHHNGRYTGSLNGSAVGNRHRASYRFFQRVAEDSPDGKLTEIVIGMWADGSACKGSTPDPFFQSHGGNCFRDIEFVPDCSCLASCGGSGGCQAALADLCPRNTYPSNTQCLFCTGKYQDQLKIASCGQPDFTAYCK